MFGTASARLSTLAGPRVALRDCSKQLVRYKSEPTHITDQFPFKDLNKNDSRNMSVAMENSAGIPLRSFLAQHRPLMLFGHQQTASSFSSAHHHEQQPRWVRPPETSARFPFLSPDQGPAFNLIPEDVARSVGPFNRQAIMRSKQLEFRQNGENNSINQSFGVDGHDRPPLSAKEVQSLLSSRFPILMNYVEKMSGEGELKMIPITLERVPNEYEEIDATSVRRKRKLKMNRHKYRKRLKEQRTKRRRLGK